MGKKIREAVALGLSVFAGAEGVNAQQPKSKAEISGEQRTGAKKETKGNSVIVEILKDISQGEKDKNNAA